MDKTSYELVSEFLRKAAAKLRSAKFLLQKEEYEDSVSRSYYAAFLAATGALTAYGLKAETHRGVATLFGLTFIKSGKLKRHLGKLLGNLREDREAGDYEAFSYVDKQIAENALKEAREFVSQVTHFLKKEKLLKSLK